MNVQKRYRCNFYINYYLPALFSRKLHAVQSNFRNVRIWYETNAEGQIQGFIEGRKGIIVKIRSIIMKILSFFGILVKAVFNEIKQIKNYGKADKSCMYQEPKSKIQ